LGDFVSWQAPSAERHRGALRHELQSCWFGGFTRCHNTYPPARPLSWPAWRHPGDGLAAHGRWRGRRWGCREPGNRRAARHAVGLATGLVAAL